MLSSMIWTTSIALGSFARNGIVIKLEQKFRSDSANYRWTHDLKKGNSDQGLKSRNFLTSII